MGIIIWIIFGALVGWVASHVMASSGGLATDIIVGIIGSVLGTFILNVLGGGGVNGFNVYSFLVALFGACLLIFIVRIIKKN